MVALQSRSFDAAVPDYRYDFLFHWAAESCSITKQDVIDSLLQEIWVSQMTYCQMLLSRVVCDTTTFHECIPGLKPICHRIQHFQQPTRCSQQNRKI